MISDRILRMVIISLVFVMRCCHWARKRLATLVFLILLSLQNPRYNAFAIIYVLAGRQASLLPRAIDGISAKAL